MSAFALSGGGALRITAPSAAAAVADAERRLAAGGGFALATLNLDHLVKLRRSEAFRTAYRAAEIVTADGNPVVWLARIEGARVALAPGSELVRPLCAMAARRGWPVAFVGATTETLARAAERLERDHPGLRTALTLAPSRDFDPVGAEADRIADALAASGARLCFLALGAPKQEVFAARARSRAPGCGFASVGAGLDFLAGTQRRAPVWVRRIAGEWLWRALGDPRRLAGRYAACAAILPGLAVRAAAARLARGRAAAGDPA